jgi:hypothetical protein
MVGEEQTGSDMMKPVILLLEHADMMKPVKRNAS